MSIILNLPNDKNVDISAFCDIDPRHIFPTISALAKENNAVSCTIKFTSEDVELNDEQNPDHDPL